MYESLTIVFVSAVVVQYLVNIVKDVFSALFNISPKLLALAFGEIICATYSVNIFYSIGFVGSNYVGIFLTGIIISAGSEQLHELFSKLRESRGIN